jgi:hypothetical protein
MYCGEFVATLALVYCSFVAPKVQHCSQSRGSRHPMPLIQCYSLESAHMNEDEESDEDDEEEEEKVG